MSAWVSAREDDCCKTAAEVVGVFGEEGQGSTKWWLYLKISFYPFIEQRDDLYTVSGGKKLPLPNEQWKWKMSVTNSAGCCGNGVNESFTT